jgi:hypothetical protein
VSASRVIVSRLRELIAVCGPDAPQVRFIDRLCVALVARARD